MSNPSHADTGSPDHGGLGHAVPMRILLGTWALLVVFTVITVAVTYVDLGELNIFVAMGIAVVKSTFVALYFMHLRWDKPFHSIVFVSAALFVMLFISLALLDTKEYAADKIPGYAPEMEAVAPSGAAADEGADGGQGEESAGHGEAEATAGGSPAAGEAGATDDGSQAAPADAEGAAADPSEPAAGH